MPVSAAKAKPSFEKTAPKYAAGDRVLVLGRGVGQIGAIAEQEVHGIPFKAMTITFDWPHLDAAGGGTQTFPASKASERLRPIMDDKDAWAKLFAIVGAEPQTGKRMGRDQMARYADNLKTNDLTELAGMLRDNRNAVLGNTPTGYAVPFIFEVVRAMELLTIELAAATDRHPAECKLFLKKIANGEVGEPARIFEAGYSVEAITPKEKKTRTRSNGQTPAGPAIDALLDELNLTTDVAKALQESAFKALNSKLYPVFVRRYLSRDIQQRLNGTQISAADLKRVLDGIPQPLRAKASSHHEANHKRYLKNLPMLAGDENAIDLFNRVFETMMAQGGLIRLNKINEIALQLRKADAASPQGPKGPRPK